MPVTSGQLDQRLFQQSTEKQQAGRPEAELRLVAYVAEIAGVGEVRDPGRRKFLSLVEGHARIGSAGDDQRGKRQNQTCPNTRRKIVSTCLVW